MAANKTSMRPEHHKGAALIDSVRQSAAVLDPVWRAVSRHDPAHRSIGANAGVECAAATANLPVTAPETA